MKYTLCVHLLGLSARVKRSFALLAEEPLLCKKQDVCKEQVANIENLLSAHASPNNKSTKLQIHVLRAKSDLFIKVFFEEMRHVLEIILFCSERI